jgi:hypothetical protein
MSGGTENPVTRVFFEGFEPKALSAFTRSNPRLRIGAAVRSAGFEPASAGFVGRCPVRLGHERVMVPQPVPGVSPAPAPEVRSENQSAKVTVFDALPLSYRRMWSAGRESNPRPSH